MLDFTTASLALGGLAAAAGPVIIHLLNRQRFRVVAWGAMDFLREALQRKRRILQVRDLLLLALRMLALIFLGLALARPFFTGGSWGRFTAAGMLALFVLAGVFAAAAVTLSQAKWRGACVALSGACLAGLLALLGWTWQDRSDGENARLSSRVPVHAVVVIDNSRSMGVETTAGKLLDRAKSRVHQFLDALPPESRVTLIPLAGSVEPFPQDAFRSQEEARRALERLRLVDVAGDVAAAFEAAREACNTTPELPTKRPCVVTDLQATAWSNIDWERWSRELPGLQIAPVSTTAPANVWISQFSLEDGIAGTEAPARFLARLNAGGTETATSVQVVLSVNGVDVGSQVVELSPGQSREVEFVHQFDLPDSSGGSEVALSIQADELAADLLASDNRVVLLAPVVSALPIVFVDQWGNQENVSQGRIGETYALRHLLAPRLADELSPRRLIQSIHVRPEQLSQELLETARLVIVAGVEAPGEIAPLLRDFVVQGGPVMILAGGGFDPVAWQSAGWLDGDGILAAPLAAQPVGAVPQESAIPKPFFADFQSMQHEDFLIAGEDPQVLASLFAAIPFFKAVQADLSPETLEAWRRVATSRAAEELAFLQAWDEDRRRGIPTDSVAVAEYRSREERWRRLEPNWWTWRTPLPLWDRGLTAEQRVAVEQPRVLAWFEGRQTPWVIERRVGAGRLMFWSSGVTSDWNLLRSSSGMYVFHRACHRLLEGTLPQRNFHAGDRITLPLATVDDDRYFLERPDGARESLTAEALGANVSGLIVRRALQSGLYRVQGESTGQTLERRIVPKLQFAVQAPASESELQPLASWTLQDAVASHGVRVLGIDEPLHLEGGRRRGQSLWKWCAAALLFVLLLEMAVLAAPESARRRPATSENSRFHTERETA